MKRILALGLLLLACMIVPAQAALPTFVAQLGEAFNADTSDDGSPSSLTIAAANVTAGSDRLLICDASTQHNSPGITITGITFGGVALTLAKASNNAFYDQQTWVLFDPAVSAADIVETYSAPLAGTDGRLTCSQYNGADAIGATNIAAGTSAAPSISLTTTATDSLAYAGIFTNNLASPFTPDAGNTERADGAAGTDPSNSASWTAIDRPAATAGIYTLSTVGVASVAWFATAVEIKSPVVAATGPPLLMLLGVGGTGGAVTPPPAGCTILMVAGSTDAQIRVQLAAAPDGAIVCLATGENVIVSNVLQMDVSQRDLTLDCQGSTLQRNFPGNVVWAQGAEIGTTAFSVSGQTISFTTVPTGLAAGDWVKLAADDPLPGGDGASTTSRPRLGQAVQIASVSGSTAIFSGTLNYSSSYLTNRRANKIQSKNATVRRCVIKGNATQTSWQQPSVQFTNVISPLVEQTKCITGLDGCVNFTNTVRGVARDIDGRNLTAGTLGVNYLVHSDASWNTQVSGLYAENTRKPFEASANDIAAATVSLAEYGAAWNSSEIDSVCYLNNGPDGCFGLRSEAQNGLIQRVYGFASPACAVASGLNNTLRDSFCIGGTTGLSLKDAVNGAASVSGDDGQGLLFDRLTIRELNSTAIAVAQGAPTNNRICSSRFESAFATPNGINFNQNLGACTFIAGSGINATLFNSIVQGAVSNTQENLYCQTCDDIAPLGVGADTVFLGTGNDLVWGGTGNDTITLGGGVDRLAYFWTDEGSDTVTDFVAGAGGDVIDVSWFVARAAGANYTGDPAADGYVATLQSGGNCLLKLDNDGTAGANAAVTVATLTGVTCSNLIASNWRYGLRG